MSRHHGHEHHRTASGRPDVSRAAAGGHRAHPPFWRAARVRRRRGGVPHRAAWHRTDPGACRPGGHQPARWCRPGGGNRHHGPGEFMGEVSGLTGKPTLVDGVAAEPVQALWLSPEQLRRLIVAEADLGERLMRALILRRTSLIESCAAGPLVIAEADDPGRARIGNFLRRNGFPFRAVTPDQDPALADLLAPYRDHPESWPLVLLADGRLRSEERRVGKGCGSRGW